LADLLKKAVGVGKRRVLRLRHRRHDCDAHKRCERDPAHIKIDAPGVTKVLKGD
jgi:hypothetical protein